MAEKDKREERQTAPKTLTAGLTVTDDDIEDCYLAESILERIRASKEKVHNNASVRKKLGLDD